MKTINTGGPAFPAGTAWAGMSMRDYFAAKAMQGLLANPKLANENLKHGGAHSGWIEDSSWAFADAMLKARNDRQANS